MSRIAFVRHGETEWNRLRRLQGRSDIPLNALGREQSAQAARMLAGGSWAGIVSSPLVRARQTAQVIAEELGMRLADPLDGLMERDYGVAEGMQVHHARARWPRNSYPQGESDAALAERGAGCVMQISRDFGGDVVVVSHGALIRAVHAALTGRDGGRVVNGGLVVLFHGKGRWTSEPWEP